MTLIDAAQRHDRFTASDAARTTKRAQRLVLEGEADAVVASLYASIRAAAGNGRGHVQRIIPPHLSASLRAAVVNSLRSDGYSVTDGAEGETIAWSNTAEHQ